MDRALPRTVVFAAFAFCYATVAVTLVRQWTSNEVYSYAFAVPLISAYIAKRRLAEAGPVVQEPDCAVGVPVLAAGLLMLIAGHLAALAALQALSLVVASCGLVLVLFGRTIFRVLWFPLAYLLFMVPVWDLPLSYLHRTSQLLSAGLATYLMQLVEVPAFRQDTLITLPAVRLEVARECSGINQLISVAAIAIPAAYVTLRGLTVRVLFVTIALIVANVSNGVRIASIGVLAYHGWNGSIHGPFHVLQGLAVSVSGYFFIFFMLGVLAKFGSRAATAPARRTTTSDPKPFRRSREVAVVVVLLVVGSYRALFHPGLVPLDKSLHLLPRDVAGWTADTSAPTPESAFGGFDDQLTRRYRTHTGQQLSLYIGYHRYQAQGKELIGEEDRLNDGHVSSDDSLAVPEAGLVLSRYRRVNPKPSEFVYWYDLNGRFVTNSYAAKLYTMVDAATRARTNGALIMVEWESLPQADSAATEEERTAFVRALIPLLRQHIPS